MNRSEHPMLTISNKFNLFFITIGRLWAPTAITIRSGLITTTASSGSGRTTATATCGRGRTTLTAISVRGHTTTTASCGTGHSDLLTNSGRGSTVIGGRCHQTTSAAARPDGADCIHHERSWSIDSLLGLLVYQHKLEYVLLKAGVPKKTKHLADNQNHSRRSQKGTTMTMRKITQMIPALIHSFPSHPLRFTLQSLPCLSLLTMDNAETVLSKFPVDPFIQPVAVSSKEYLCHLMLPTQLCMSVHAACWALRQRCGSVD